MPPWRRTASFLGARLAGRPAAALALFCAVAPIGCGAADRAAAAAGSLVNGLDNRQEYFEVASPDERALMASSLVAFVPKVWLRASPVGLAPDVPTWGTDDGLCADEPFADQPAAAFCSGVLVDWDLVLTAGHCLRLLAPEDFAAVFDYHYQAPRQLAVSDGDVFDVVDIISEALDPASSEPRLDYGWVRLGRPVAPPRRPVSLHVHSPSLRLGDPIVSIGTGGGVPMKLDAGGVVRALREPWADYFIADTDTSHGSSGAAAFDAQLALLGVFVRGGDDSVLTPSGCNRTIRQPDGAVAEEQFTYAFRAVEGLCAQSPSVSSLCRTDCGDPCRALDPPARVESGGCSVSAAPPLPIWALSLCSSILGLAGAATRRRRTKPLDVRQACLSRGRDGSGVGGAGAPPLR